MIDYRALAETETPALRLRVLEAVDSSAEPLSAALVARQLRADLSRVAYHCRRLEANGLTKVAREQEKPYRELFYAMAGAAA